MKIQRNYRYHTKWLIPESVAKEAFSQTNEDDVQDIIERWNYAYRSEHHFKEGDTCYHIRDLEQPLAVDKILRSYPKPRNGETQKSKIDGILVHWHQQINLINN